MILKIRDLNDGHVTEYPLNSQEDFTELFRQYPGAEWVAKDNGKTFKTAANAISIYLSNFNTDCWLEGADEYIRPDIAYNKTDITDPYDFSDYTEDDKDEEVNLPEWMLIQNMTHRWHK